MSMGDRWFLFPFRGGEFDEHQAVVEQKVFQDPGERRDQVFARPRLAGKSVTANRALPFC
jgi:hypothetical protein